MNTRPILIAVMQTVVLFAAGFLIPFVGQIVALFTPVPLILVLLRHGRRDGLAALAGSCLVAVLLGGWQLGAILLFGFGLMALGAAVGMQKGMQVEQTALLAGLLPMCAAGLMVGWYFLRIGKNPFDAADAAFRSSLGDAAKLYKQLGMHEMAAVVSGVPDRFIHTFVRLLPGIGLATSVAQAACCIGVARALLAKNPGAAPRFASRPFAVWHAPDTWVWGLIGCLALFMLPHELPRLIGWNLAILYAVVYGAQGTAIVDFYLRKFRVRPFMRGLMLGILIAFPSAVFLVALGIVDIWADVRKVRVPASGPPSR